MPGPAFVIGDRVLAKADGRTMDIVSIRASGSKRTVVYCAWGPTGHRVIQLFQPEQIQKAPRSARSGERRASGPALVGGPGADH